MRARHDMQQIEHFFALSIMQGKATSTSMSTLFNKNIDYNKLARKIADQLKGK